MPVMTNAEWAAWVQAVGAILALGGMLWQSHKQHRSALEMFKLQQSATRRDQAESVAVLAEAAHKIVCVTNMTYRDRNDFHGPVHSDNLFIFGELLRVESAATMIPLHAMPSEVVRVTLTLASTCNRYRRLVETAQAENRAMDADRFDQLFRTMGEIEVSLSETVNDAKAAARQAA